MMGRARPVARGADHPQAAARRVGRPLLVRLVVGSLPPQLCGIGHYTERLGEALRDLGHDVQAIRQTKIDSLGAVVANLPEGALVHLQYPSVGARASMAPLAGALRRRHLVLTAHEFTEVHPLRRAMVVALANAASLVVVTNSHERLALGRWAPRTGFEVVPVGANVVATAAAQPRVLSETNASAPYTVGFFGMVMPGRGLEQFLDFARRAHDVHGSRCRFVIVGGWHERHSAQVGLWQANHADLPLHWTGRLGDADVSAALATFDAAYLPFPDGLSDRRTTAMAIFGHGVPLFSTDGSSSTAALQRCIRTVASPAEAVAAMGSLDRAGLQRHGGRGPGVRGEPQLGGGGPGPCGAVRPVPAR